MNFWCPFEYINVSINPSLDSYITKSRSRVYHNASIKYHGNFIILISLTRIANHLFTHCNLYQLVSVEFNEHNGFRAAVLVLFLLKRTNIIKLKI